MELHIITPRQNRVIPVEWVEINTPAGNMVIQPNHAPLIATLTPHSRCIFATGNNQTESFVVSLCVVEVTREKVVLLMHEE